MFSRSDIRSDAETRGIDVKFPMERLALFSACLEAACYSLCQVSSL